MNPSNAAAFFTGSLLVVCAAAIAHGGVQLDQSYDAVVDSASSNNGTALTAAQALTQSFTSSLAGRLVQVDLQVATTAPFPTTGIVLDIRPTVNDAPTSSSLGSFAIPLQDIPPRFPLVGGQGQFVSVDVSSAGIVVNPGDVLALEVTLPTNTGALTWFTGGVTGYPGGRGFFRNPPSTEYGPVNGGEFGFRTFVLTVPEPASAGLLLVALMSAAVRPRRRSYRSS